MKAIKVKANANKEALGRVWTDDAALRDALSVNPELIFSAAEAYNGYPTEWCIFFRRDGSLLPLVAGRLSGLRFGAELFRKLTGKEVDVNALL